MFRYYFSFDWVYNAQHISKLKFKAIRTPRWGLLSLENIQLTSNKSNEPNEETLKGPNDNYFTLNEKNINSVRSSEVTNTKNTDDLRTPFSST